MLPVSTVLDSMNLYMSSWSRYPGHRQRHHQIRLILGLIVLFLLFRLEARRLILYLAKRS